MKLSRFELLRNYAARVDTYPKIAYSVKASSQVRQNSM